MSEPWKLPPHWHRVWPEPGEYLRGNCFRHEGDNRPRVMWEHCWTSPAGRIEAHWLTGALAHRFRAVRVDFVTLKETARDNLLSLRKAVEFVEAEGDCSPPACSYPEFSRERVREVSRAFRWPEKTVIEKSRAAAEICGMPPIEGFWVLWWQNPIRDFEEE